MSDERVKLSIENHIAHVTLARPDKLNALDPAMFNALAEMGGRLQNESGVRAVVLSGQGRAFCAGLDISSMGSGGLPRDLMPRSYGNANLVQEVAVAWRKLPMPVVAAVHGICFGGGLQIMSGADIKVCAPDTRLSVMEMRWGLVPDMGGFDLWRGLVRNDVLRELAYTAREFTGEEAQKYGFVTHVEADPLDRAQAIAVEIAARNPDAVRGVKRLAQAVLDQPGDEILLAESREQMAVIGKPNQMEAVRAGMAKQAGNFVDP